MPNIGTSIARLVLVLQCAPVLGQVTQRINLSSSGAPANNNSAAVSMSADGRYVVFLSSASNLVSGDTNATWDVFVRDRQRGTTERISVDSAGVQANGESQGGWISPNGRYVSFSSYATNLVPGDTNGRWDAYLRDRASGTTERTSIGQGSVEPNDSVYGGPVVSDGRYVLLFSFATNLIPGGTNGQVQVLVRDRHNGTAEMISISSSGVQGNADSYDASISDDAQYVSFVSWSSNLVPGDTNNGLDVFVRDRINMSTERVSVSSAGAEGGYSDEVEARISSLGRYVAFMSGSSNLVPGDTNLKTDIFLHDRQNGITERVSVDSSVGQCSGNSFYPAVSQNGQYVQFTSEAPDLVLGDTNGMWDVFVRDRVAGQTERVSIGSGGEQATANSASIKSMSSDGRFVAFGSFAANLVPSDTNASVDVFVRDRVGGTAFVTNCDPGMSAVIGCPCSNPPTGGGRGCDNSSGTGGAVLSALGGAYLSSDSLVLSASGEKPTSLSIVTQWTGTSPTGVAFGMGVRCTSGTLKRLYTKQAVGGSITAPDFGASDLQISVRSASVGLAIQSGQSLWYLVHYRDQGVLGGCPPTSNFNCTQTGQVTWSP